MVEVIALVVAHLFSVLFSFVFFLFREGSASIVEPQYPVEVVDTITGNPKKYSTKNVPYYGIHCKENYCDAYPER